MAMRRFIDRQSGRHRLYGCNVGIYPRHDFHQPPGGDAADFNFPVRITCAGPDEWVKGCWRKREKSDSCALEYVTRGTFEFTQNQKHWTVSPGQLFFVRLEADNMIECKIESAAKRVVQLAGPNVPGLFESLNLSRADVITLNDRESVDALYDRIDELCCNSGGADTAIEASTLAYRLLLVLAREARHSHFPSELVAALDYLQNHVHEKFSLTDLIRQTGSSKSSLYRVFQEHLNVTPFAYHSRLRVARATALLKLNLYSVKEIAAMLGYSSAQNFATDFRKRCGFTPGRYRE